MAKKPHIPSVPKNDDGPDESVTTSSAGGESLLLPGGTVDPDALRRAVESAQASTSEDGAERESDDVLPRVVFTLNRDLQKRLDKYLTDRITFMSRNQLQKLIDKGGVTVNSRVPKASTVLRAGDVVEVLVPPPPSRVCERMEKVWAARRRGPTTPRRTRRSTPCAGLLKDRIMGISRC